MQIIKTPVLLRQLWEESESGFTELIKIVVDIDQEIIAADAEMHADLEELLLENGSKQEFLWGANIYPTRPANELIEYTAFINIRPAMDNRSMEIVNEEVRVKIDQIINKLIVI